MAGRLRGLPHRSEARTQAADVVGPYLGLVACVERVVQVASPEAPDAVAGLVLGVIAAARVVWSERLAAVAVGS